MTAGTKSAEERNAQAADDSGRTLVFALKRPPPMKYSMCLSVVCSQASCTAVNEDKRDNVGFAGADASALCIPFIRPFDE